MSGLGIEKKEATIIQHFELSDRSGWFILGLIKSSHTDIEDLVKKEIQSVNGDAALNLQIETVYDPLDIIISVLVGGIYNSRQIKIEGDVIKYK